MSIPPRHVPVALYTFGVCYHGRHWAMHRTGQVVADSLAEAKTKAHTLLQPSTVETLILSKTEPNPEYQAYREEYAKAHGLPL